MEQTENKVSDVAVTPENSKPADNAVHNTENGPTAEKKSENCIPAEEKSENCIPAEEKTENCIPAEEKSENCIPAEEKTENCIPVEEKTENGVPTEAKMENGDANENSSNSNADNSNDKSESKINDEELTDAMMENLHESFNQDVDSMVSLMESAEDFMFETDNKRNIKAAIEANKRKGKEQKSAIDSDKSEAYSLLAQGKRNCFVKDYESAVTTLGEACQKLNAIYGEFALELGDAYMTYGNALLELWRIEEAEKKTSEDAPEEIKEVDNEDEEDDEKELETEEKENGEGDGDVDEKNEEDGEEKNEEDGEEKNEDDDEEDIENEEDNLQIAWEVVEIAKEIYVRHNDDSNLAKAYAKLGEISIAAGNHTLAIEDLNRSLEIQNKLDPADNRLKANTHFNLYVAYSTSHEYDKSAEQLDIAKSVFQNQVDDLSKKLKTLEESEVAEITKIKTEINDTEEILRDMDSKILENNKHKREFMTAVFEAIKNRTGDANGDADASGSTSTIGFDSEKSGVSGSAPVVHNINHLIHKKPKPKPKLEASENEKIQKQVVSQNGQSAIDGKIETNGLSNGEEKKRKLSESNESSPKKVCLRQE